MTTSSPPAPSPLADSLLEALFSRAGGELALGGFSLSGLVEIYGSPLFIYDADRMRGNLRRLRQALDGFAKVYYSVKANPHPAIAGVFVAEGAGLEVASGAEFLAARASGCGPENILFAGPGKGPEELELTIREGIGEIHLESLEEISRIAAIAARFGRKVDVAVRVNPVAAARGGAMRMGGYPSAFGFDEESLPDILAAVGAHPPLDLTGLHFFTGTQILDAQVLLRQWTHALDVGARTARLLGRPLRTIDLGGGLGVPYHTGDVPLDLRAVAQGVSALRERIGDEPLLRDAAIIVEPGRFLVGDAGVYVMRVRAVKISRGTRFIITDGGMHHHLAASGNLGQVIKRDYPILPVGRLDAPRTEATIVGPLCTPLDTLGRTTRMPDMEAGGLIAVLQSGAYGLTASPVGFLSHPMPAEVLVDAGEHRVIRRRGTFESPASPPVQLPPRPQAR